MPLVIVVALLDVVRLSDSTNGNSGLAKPGSDRITLVFEMPDRDFKMALNYTAGDYDQVLTVYVNDDYIVIQLSKDGGTTYIGWDNGDYLDESININNVNWIDIYDDVTITVEASSGSHLKDDTTLDLVFGY